MALALALCVASALLVGASVGWIQDSERRYRHVVGHIPGDESKKGDPASK